MERQFLRPPVTVGDGKTSSRRIHRLVASAEYPESLQKVRRFLTAIERHVRKLK